MSWVLICGAFVHVINEIRALLVVKSHLPALWKRHHWASIVHNRRRNGGTREMLLRDGGARVIIGGAFVDVINEERTAYQCHKTNQE